MSDDDLIVVATYPSGVEAGFAQQLLEEAGISAKVGADSSATWLSYVGTAIGGVSLLIRRADMAEAAAVLQSSDSTPDQFEWPEVHDDEEAEEETTTLVEPHPHLVRAFRAAVVGCFLAPLGVPLYSLYLIARHRLFLPDRGGNDWRFYVAMLANTFGLYIGKMYWSSYWY
jgi:hypothetical protein